MSNVSNVILVFAIGENRKSIIGEVKKFKYNGLNPFEIVSIDDESLPRKWYGGSKMMECNVCIGCYNYLDLNGLIEFLANINWEYPEDVQLIVKDENESKFRIIDVFSFL